MRLKLQRTVAVLSVMTCHSWSIVPVRLMRLERQAAGFTYGRRKVGARAGLLLLDKGMQAACSVLHPYDKTVLKGFQ